MVHSSLPIQYGISIDLENLDSMADISSELYTWKEQINPLEWIRNLRERITQFDIKLCSNNSYLDDYRMSVLHFKHRLGHLTILFV